MKALELIFLTEEGKTTECLSIALKNQLILIK